MIWCYKYRHHIWEYFFSLTHMVYILGASGWKEKQYANVRTGNRMHSVFLNCLFKRWLLKSPQTRRAKQKVSWSRKSWWCLPWTGISGGGQFRRNDELWGREYGDSRSDNPNYCVGGFIVLSALT